MNRSRTSGYRSCMGIAAAMLISTLVLEKAATKHASAFEKDPTLTWAGYLQEVNEALAKKNVSAAVRAWHNAYVTALESRRWEGMIEVGDAYLRIGEVSGIREASKPKARTIYLAAFFRARQQGSIDGVLRTVEAFAALGDREVVGQGLRVAEQMAARARDAQARDRVRTFAAQLDVKLMAPVPPDPEYAHDP